MNEARRESAKVVGNLRKSVRRSSRDIAKTGDRDVDPRRYRKQSSTTPDPLGAVDADPPVGLRRKDLYKGLGTKAAEPRG
jgi:hypothetical protein